MKQEKEVHLKKMNGKNLVQMLRNIRQMIYTQYVLQGTAYKGQLWQLVEFGKKLRDRLVFFPKIKGQDTIYQGTKD